MLNCFDNDDRIVHNNTDGQHKTEHGQRVDRKTERNEKCKCADDGNRDRKHGDQRCTPALKKEKHYQNNKPEGFNQRPHDFVDRHLHNGNRFKRDDIINVLWKRFFQIIHDGVNAFCNFESIAPRRLIHEQVRRSFAVDK